LGLKLYREKWDNYLSYIVHGEMKHGSYLAGVRPAVRLKDKRQKSKRSEDPERSVGYKTKGWISFILKAAG
jgi:hypothetical protein